MSQKNHEMIDGKGNVLALDKVNDSYTGTTFPGGHVEGRVYWILFIRKN